LVPGLKYGAFPYLLHKFFSEETTELSLASTSTTYTPVAHSAMPSIPIELVRSLQVADSYTFGGLAFSCARDGSIVSNNLLLFYFIKK
jgi:hypothetical protein